MRSTESDRPPAVLESPGYRAMAALTRLAREPRRIAAAERELGEHEPGR